jgi:fucose permease
MTVGRFAGGPFLNRYGRVPVLRVSAMAAVAGIGCVSLVDDQGVAAMGVLLWGLGVSLGFPVAMSAAGDPADSGGDPAARVSLVATMGYLAFLVGPPLLGVIGQDYGLRPALLVPLGLLVLTVFLAPALQSRVTGPDADGGALPAL